MHSRVWLAGLLLSSKTHFLCNTQLLYEANIALYGNISLYGQSTPARLFHKTRLLLLWQLRLHPNLGLYKHH